MASYIPIALYCDCDRSDGEIKISLKIGREGSSPYTTDFAGISTKKHDRIFIRVYTAVFSVLKFNLKKRNAILVDMVLIAAACLIIM